MKKWLCNIAVFFLYVSGNGQTVTQCRYWLNNSFSQATMVNTSSSTIDLNIDYSTLPIGYYQINFQVKQSDGKWSSPTTDLFYKASQSNGTAQGYRYWFNNDYAKAVTVAGSIESLDINIPYSSAPIGYYQVNYQFKDNSGKWSSPITHWFYKSGTTRMLVKACKYWFDNDTAKIKTISLFSSTYSPIIGNLDVESLSLGKHVVNMQFQDDGGMWSSITTDTFNRKAITAKVIIAPKVLVQRAIINKGDVQLITGSDFTSNGEIQLKIINPKNEEVGNNIPITYINYGKFSYSLPVDASFEDGLYKAYATDVTTGISSPEIRFRVNNPAATTLWISAPTATDNYLINKNVNISWGDFIKPSSVLGLSAFIEKHYKIEFSNDNGVNWQTIEANLTRIASINTVNSFLSSCTFPSSGTYKIRVTDLDIANNQKVSNAFIVSSPIPSGVTGILEWDNYYKSVYQRPAKPEGLAADGVSRIFVHLVKNANNTKAIKRIVGKISSSDGYLDTNMLGKIMFANVTNTYSEEASSADSIVETKIFNTPSASTDFYFWLVAPNDFIQNGNSDLGERYVAVKFSITYSDNSTEDYFQTGIKIVRPPLLMVHGLNGSNESFNNAKLNIGIGVQNFKKLIEQKSIWKYGNIPNMINYGSFDANANELLNNPQVSLEAATYNMELSGYACKRVDYVCHSMGGCMARTVINKYPTNYFSSKNYKKGFINKLITINTPHNGSPIADFVFDIFNKGFFLPTRDMTLGGFFVARKAHSNGTTYKPSPAIEDLRAVNGGVRFNETIVKNHLIGGDIDRYNIPDALSVAILNGDLETKKLLLKLVSNYPKAVIASNAIINFLNLYISTKYYYPNFFSNSDLVVPVSSQFPSVNILSLPEVDNLNATPANGTNSYGLGRNHLSITDDLAIGNKVMQLLNSPINSAYFADKIAANPNPNGTSTYSPVTTGDALDSVFTYFDSLHLKIVSPQKMDKVYVDSSINIKVFIKDTVGLKKLQLIFQGEYYESFSKVANQTFSIKVQSNAIGYNTAMLRGYYDSTGYSIFRIDTTTLNVVSKDTLQGFFVSPKSQTLNTNQLFQIDCNAVYKNYIGLLNDNIDSLTFTIADTSIVRYIDSIRQFTTKDSGSTYIVFRYKGFADTAYIYLTKPATICNKPVLGKDTTVYTCVGTKRSLKNIFNTSAYSDVRWSTTTPDSVGAGTYTLIASTGKNCSDTVVISVIEKIINPVLNPKGIITICSGDSLSISVNGIYKNYLWNTGQTNSFISIKTAGTYFVTVTDSIGCSKSTSATTLKLKARPTVPKITSMPSITTSLCPGTNVVLSSSSATRYLWNTGDTSRSINIDSAGIYSVKVFNNNGCYRTSSNKNISYICNKPLNTNAFNLTKTSVTLLWSPVTCKSRYDLQYRKKGTKGFITLAVTDTFVNVSGLSASTLYEWRVRTVCVPSPFSASSYSPFKEFTTALLRARPSVELPEIVDAKMTIIYPNPTSKQATLLVKGFKNYTVAISNAEGKKLWQSQALNANSVVLPVENYLSGLYMVTIANNLDEKTLRLIIQK